MSTSFMHQKGLFAMDNGATTGFVDDFQTSDQWLFHEYLGHKWSETCVLPDFTSTFGVYNA